MDRKNPQWGERPPPARGSGTGSPLAGSDYCPQPSPSGGFGKSMVSARLAEVAEPCRLEPRCPACGAVSPWRDGCEPSGVRTWCRPLCGALDSLSKPSPLILDDFLITPIENSLNAVDLFETLEAREGRASTLLVSRLESGQLFAA